MSGPREALDAGIDSILPFLRAHGQTFVPGDAGRGSGGFFASGSLVGGDCHVSLSYRYGLGAITLEAGGMSIRFDDYLRAMGASSDARYPWTRVGAPDQFEALAHLLTAAARSDGLVAFWSSFPDDLPRATSLANLHQIVERQIAIDPFGGEFYVEWTAGQ